jgi:hypothetical protein
MTDSDPRWIVTVIYRSDQGAPDNVFLIEELDELQSIRTGMPSTRSRSG